jgi:putative sigma-54 modulation protein
MYRQIERFKGKRANRHRGGAPEDLEVEVQAEEESRIARVKRFEVWPMNADEAIEQMELLGHDFFIFFNADEGGVNVIYRRRDGNYGLLQPIVT